MYISNEESNMIMTQKWDNNYKFSVSDKFDAGGHYFCMSRDDTVNFIDFEMTKEQVEQLIKHLQEGIK
jgi:hypothetical protein